MESNREFFLILSGEDVKIFVAVLMSYTTSCIY